MNLNDLLETVVTETPNASRRDIADAVLEQLTVAERAEALEIALPAYIGAWMSERRQWKPEPLPPEFRIPEPKFAPDDLLAPDVQELERKRKDKMLKGRGSARVTAIRTEWQKHFSDSLWTGTKTIKLGDATAEDLRQAAATHRNQAKDNFERMLERADRYEKIAAALTDGQKVRDLKDDPTRV